MLIGESYATRKFSRNTSLFAKCRPDPDEVLDFFKLIYCTVPDS